MIFRWMASLAIALMASPLAAQCTGTAYLDELSQDQTEELQAAIADVPYGRGLFWQATKGDKTVTVAGTIHIYDARLEPLIDQLRPAIRAADMILLEATPEDQAELQAMLATSPDLVFINEGPTLPDLVGDATWDQIAEAAKARSVPGFLAAKMQPWYLSLLLSVPPCAMADMLAGNMGLDHMIMEEAEAAGVPMQGIENILTLFEIFDDAPLDNQIDMLRGSLLQPELQQKLFVSMMDEYFKGEIARLWEMTRFAMMDAPEAEGGAAQKQFEQMENALLIQRNRNWQPVMGEVIAQNDQTFIAVGAAHLMGESGILTFLATQGWDITPLQ